VNLDKFSLVPKEQRGYCLAGVFFLYSNNIEVFERYCKGLEDDPENEQLIIPAQILLDHMKRLFKDNVALTASKKHGIEHDYEFKVTEEGKSMAIVAPYFEDLVDEYKKEIQSVHEIHADTLKSVFIDKIESFFCIQNKWHDLDASAEISKIPLATCKKIEKKTAEKAYKICLIDTFNEAAIAFKAGKSIEEVQKQTGLGTTVSKVIQKDPDVEIKGRVYTKYEKIAWLSDPTVNLTIGQ
jgi:hypothetical protein